MGVSVISAWQEIRNGFDFSYLLSLLLSVVPSLLCITLHELSHGLVAYRLGDPTAKNAGRLTLNPLKHLDPIGLLMMMTVHVGWAKPVPVNMYRFENPKKGMAITALAGPAMNVLITIVFLFAYGLLFRPLKGDGIVLEMVYLTAYLSISFAIFNLLPISPLDGSKVLFSVLPSEQYDRLMHYERYGMILLMVLVASGVFGRPLTVATRWVFDKLFIFAEWGYELVGTIH